MINTIRAAGMLISLLLISCEESSTTPNCFTYDAVEDSAEHSGLRVFASDSVPVFDMNVQTLMRRYCIYIDSNTCCDETMVRHMISRLGKLETLMDSDDSDCFSTFTEHVCHQTCSPDQAIDMQIKQYRMEMLPNTFSNNLTLPAHSRMHVQSIVQFVTTKWLNAIFKKCAKVGKLPILICDPSASHCTPLYWLQQLNNRIDQPPWYITYALQSADDRPDFQIRALSNGSSSSNDSSSKPYTGPPFPGMHRRKGIRTLNPPMQRTHMDGYWMFIKYMMCVMLTVVLLKMWSMEPSTRFERPATVMERIGEYTDSQMRRMLTCIGAALSAHPIATVVCLFSVALCSSLSTIDIEWMEVDHKVVFGANKSWGQRNRAYMQTQFELRMYTTVMRQAHPAKKFPDNFHSCAVGSFIDNGETRNQFYPKYDKIGRNGMSYCHRVPSHAGNCYQDSVSSITFDTIAKKYMKESFEANANRCLQNNTADRCYSIAGSWYEPEDVIGWYDRWDGKKRNPTYAYHTTIMRLHHISKQFKEDVRRHDLAFQYYWDAHLFANLSIAKCNVSTFTTYQTTSMARDYFSMFAKNEPAPLTVNIVCALLMKFVYVAVVLRQGHMRTLLALGVVAVQVVSPFSAVGLMVTFGYPPPDDISFVLPTVILSFGADNMMLIAIVEQYGIRRKEGKPLAAYIGGVFGECGPVVLMHVLTSSAVCLLSAWSVNPVVCRLGIQMAVALLVNGVLQSMLFIGLLAFDCYRIDRRRCDPCTCVDSRRTHDHRYGLIDVFIVHVWTPVINFKLTRVAIVFVYVYSMCLSLHELYFVNAGGLYQCLEKMPANNAKYHEYSEMVRDVGPELYVTVRGQAIDYKLRAPQNIVLGSLVERANDAMGPSIIDNLLKYHKKENQTYIYFVRPRNWLQWFIIWVRHLDCCYMVKRAKTFCQNLVVVESLKNASVKCEKCDYLTKDMKFGRISERLFYEYLTYFLDSSDNKINSDWTGKCRIGGQMLFDEVRINTEMNRLIYYVRLFHKKLTTPEMHVRAVLAARLLAKNLTHELQIQYHGLGTMSAEELADIEVIVYSPDHIMYEQFIDLFSLAFRLMLVGLFIIWMLHWLLNGLNGTTASLVVGVSFSISVQMATLLLRYNLTPLTLMYVVQSLAVGVYCCSLTAWAWTHSMQKSPETRMANVLRITGRPMLHCIICTKLFGLVPMYYMYNQDYFNISFYLFIVASSRAILLMPALLLLFGPQRSPSRKMAWADRMNALVEYWISKESKEKGHDASSSV